MLQVMDKKGEAKIVIINSAKRRKGMKRSSKRLASRQISKTTQKRKTISKDELMNTKKDFCSKVLLANMLLHLPKWEENCRIMIKLGAKETWCTKNQIEDIFKRM